MKIGKKFGKQNVEPSKTKGRINYRETLEK